MSETEIYTLSPIVKCFSEDGITAKIFPMDDLRVYSKADPI